MFKTTWTWHLTKTTILLSDLTVQYFEVDEYREAVEYFDVVEYFEAIDEPAENRDEILNIDELDKADVN